MVSIEQVPQLVTFYYKKTSGNILVIRILLQDKVISTCGIPIIINAGKVIYLGQGNHNATQPIAPSIPNLLN